MPTLTLYWGDGVVGMVSPPPRPAAAHHQVEEELKQLHDGHDGHAQEQTQVAAHVA